MTTPTTQCEADERTGFLTVVFRAPKGWKPEDAIFNHPHFLAASWSHALDARDRAIWERDQARAALTAPVAAPEAPLCQWPTCQPEAVQQQIAKDVADSLYGGAPEAPSQYTARDWIEDAQHENGNYQCKCSNCGNTFIGHKRRITCKVCAHPAATDQPSTGQVSERAAFEAHIGPKAGCEFRNADGSYQVSDVQKAWSIWQARASLTPTAPSAEITAACETARSWIASYPTEPQAANIEGYSIKHVEGHGWLIDPPQGSRWVAFEDTPAGDFVAAIMKRAPQAATTASAVTCLNCGRTSGERRDECEDCPAPVQAAQPALRADVALVKANFMDALGNAIRKFAALGPEDDEDWESWYSAVLDMLSGEVDKEFAIIAAPGAAQTTDAREG